MKAIEVETEAFGLREGQRLPFAIHPARQVEIVVKPMRESYAGISTGVFGATEAERESYVGGERDSWI